LIIIFSGVVVACSPGNPYFEIKTIEGESCKFSGFAYNSFTDGDWEPNKTNDIEPILTEQSYSDCRNIELSNQDERRVYEIVTNRDFRDHRWPFSKTVLVQQSSLNYRIFNAQATLVNLYPCDCIAYEKITRKGDWTAFNRARDCGNGASCNIVTPPICLLGFVLILPILFVTPLWASKRTVSETGKLGFVFAVILGLPGLFFHGYIAGIVGAALGWSIEATYRERPQMPPTDSTIGTAALVFILILFSFANLLSGLLLRPFLSGSVFIQVIIMVLIGLAIRDDEQNMTK
jgi:hypothetical protein